MAQTRVLEGSELFQSTIPLEIWIPAFAGRCGREA
jgi:hypothetical protein